MAMHKKVNSVAYSAATDLSSAQYRVVGINSSGQVNTQADGNAPPLGVLLNKPGAAGAGAEVAVEGSDIKLEAIAAIDEGQLVVASTGGRGSAIGGTASGTTWVVGICTQAASGSGAFAGVLVRPYFHVRP